MAVQLNHARKRIVETHEKIHDCRFANAACSGDGREFSSGKPEARGIKHNHFAAGHIGHTFEFDLAAEFADEPGIRCFLHLNRGIDNLETSAHGCPCCCNI